MTFGRTWLLSGLLFLAGASCTEFRESVPTGSDPIPSESPGELDIVGHWEADSSQGRRIAFDVTSDGRVVNGRINLHHDCNKGRWRATFDGFETEVVQNTFITTMDWQANDGGLIRRGRVTISGRFESDRTARGAFINSVNDVRRNERPTGEICPAIYGSFEGLRDP